MSPDVRVARIYREPAPDDGHRVLVDRLWPRGLRKDSAPLDEWLKDAAPSTELRKWYGHDPAKFEEFRRRYAVELAGPAQRAALAHLRTLAGTGNPLTLLTATKDVAHSQAAILANLLRQDQEAAEPACYAHLTCPACGATLTDPHAPTCPHASHQPRQSRSTGLP